MQPKQPDQQVQLVYSKKLGTLSKPLGSFPPLKQLCASCEKYFCLSPSGQIFTLSNQYLSKLSIPVTIHKICSSKETVLFLADIGVYFQGFDIISNDFSFTIKPVDTLLQVRLTDAGIGLTHASAVDDLGNLYVWGNLYNEPEIVQSSKVFTCTKVQCGDFITCVTTTGGYFYVYGTFNTLDPGLTPSSFSELERYFVVDFCVGNGFCVVVTEDGLILAFESSNELVPLKSLSNIQGMYIFNSGVFLFTSGNVYKWHGPCVKEWQLEVFTATGKFWVLGEASGALAVQGAVNWELKNETSKSDLLEKMLSPKGKNNEKKVYSQYFPQDNSYNKLLEYRKQHKIATNVLQFFSPICLSAMKWALDRIKKYTEQKVLMKKTQVWSELPVWVMKVSQKLRYLNMAFAFEKMQGFTRAQVRKEKEIIFIKKNQARGRAVKLLECFKRLCLREKFRYGEILIGIARICLKVGKKKLGALKTFLVYSKKLDRERLSCRFYCWVEIFHWFVRIAKGFSRLRKTCLKKLGGFAFRLIKSFHFYRRLKLNSLQRAILLLYKQSYIESTIWYFNKWTKIRFKSEVRREKSSRLYLSLAKNIFSVIHHKYKSLLKFAFLNISSHFLYNKLIKQYKNPLLYFSTVFSKIICRLKFSIFTAIQRLREKTSFTLNLDLTDRLNNLCFVLEKIYQRQMNSVLYKINQINRRKKGVKNNTLGDIHEQTLTFFNNPGADYENPFILNQTIPKLKLNTVEKPPKPPISSRHQKNYVKLPPKHPQRSGSSTGTGPREDSLSRRINYDNQLRKKLKNFEKFSPKGVEAKSVEKLLAKKTPTRKYIEVRSTDRDTPKNNEDFFKISLAVLGLRKFIEKNEFTSMLATFKILKSCFKYSKNPYSRCFRYSPDKSDIFN